MFRSYSQQCAVAVLLVFVGQLALPTFAVAQSTPLTGVVVKGRKYTGKVIFRDSATLALLRRDGGLSTYSAPDVNSTIKLPQEFRPYSRDELEDRLRGEFPNGYSVAFTDNFAVVFPTNSSFGWSSAFERLHRQFNHYFEARGFALKQPGFPLIAVVLRTRAEFDRYLERIDLKNPTNIVGIYSLKTNRVITYDQAISADSGRADENLATVIHEAAHQSAFNTGIHERFRPVPRWVTEGLATMFEAKGVYNSVEYPQRRDRLAAVYWRDLQALLDADTLRGKIKSMICSDELFDDEPKSAYALAWGLTFFLAENRAEGYQAYLQATKQRGDFSRDNAEQRLHDFCSVFGDDLRDLESRLMTYYRELADEK